MSVLVATVLLSPISIDFVTAECPFVCLTCYKSYCCSLSLTSLLLKARFKKSQGKIFKGRCPLRKLDESGCFIWTVQPGYFSFSLKATEVK